MVFWLGHPYFFRSSLHSADNLVLLVSPVVGLLLVNRINDTGEA